MTLPTQILSTIIRAVPAVIPFLTAETLIAIKAAGYDGIRTVMSADIFGSVFGYLSGTGYVSAFRLDMATAISKGYIETLDAAYIEGGGDLPVDEDTVAWARGVLDSQLSYVDSLFETLKDLRSSGDFDAGEIASARAEGYASALDGFFTEAKMRGSKNIMLTWHLGSTEKHCKTCASLDGGQHKISWYIDRNYIPRKPDAGMDCHGYNCDCRLEDKNGTEYGV